jgi:glycosyltransferase involved in cell wall biosynthesis
MNTVALCIPAYNAAHFLPGLLTSAKGQLIPFNEILVYDDCSSDNTAQVAEAYGAKVIKGASNKGCSFGKNVLAKAAVSDWLHFHDADDDLLPNFGQEINNWISDHPEYEVLLLNFNYIDHRTGVLLGRADHKRNELHRDALKYAINNKIVNFALYKRGAFLQAGGFDLDPQVLFNEDNAVHQRLAMAGLKFDYLPVITCINYRYDTSMSVDNKLKCARANYHVIAKTAAKFAHIYPAELSRQLWNCITITASLRDWEYVRKGLSLLKNIDPRFRPAGSGAFAWLSKLDLYFAVWLRERMIRLLKPSLRKEDSVYGRK